MVALVRDVKRNSAPAERRLFTRMPMLGEVEARRLDHSIPAHRRPRINLQLRDLSLGGLCAMADQPLAAGEYLSVSIPPTHRSPGWDAFGRILRCQPTVLGYRVAMEFESLPAA